MRRNPDEAAAGTRPDRSQLLIARPARLSRVPCCLPRCSEKNMVCMLLLASHNSSLTLHHQAVVMRRPWLLVLQLRTRGRRRCRFVLGWRHNGCPAHEAPLAWCWRACGDTGRQLPPLQALHHG